MRPLSVSVLEEVLDRDALRSLVADRVASGIAAGGARPTAPDWPSLDRAGRALLPEARAVLQDSLAASLQRVVLCSTGRSALTPQVVAGAAGKSLDVLDTADPRAIRRALSDRLDETLVVVSDATGEAAVTRAHARAFIAALRGIGADPGERAVIITHPDSPLERFARGEGCRYLVHGDPQVGLASALSASTLVPSALAGADVQQLLDEAEAVASTLAADSEENPALVLGTAIAAHAVPGPGASRRDKVAIADVGSDAPGLAAWVEQVVAGTVGRDGRGLLPVAVEGADAPEIARPLADTLALALGDGSGPLPPTAQAAVTGPLGAQLLLWEVAAAVATHLLGGDPRAGRVQRPVDLDLATAPDPALFVDEGIEVRATKGLLDGVFTLPEALVALERSVPSDGYLGVSAHLDPVAATEAGLLDVRSLLALRTGRPVTFSWGSRAWHAQGHDPVGTPIGGGLGAFLQITAAVADDLDVPGRPYTFGQILAAQAAGDAQALAEQGRPLLRLHLRDRAAGVARLREVLA